MKNSRAFTLIELLVVVLIIGILAAVAVPQYQKAVYKSRATEAFTILNQLVKAERIYYLANQEYTEDWAKLDIEIPSELATSTWEETNYEDKYSYFCSSEYKTCVAKTSNVNMPFFQMNLFNERKYCISDTSKSNISKSICQSMGTEDTTRGASQKGQFFILSN